MALAAKAAAAAARGFGSDRERLLGLAHAELDLLKVSHHSSPNKQSCHQK